MRRIVYKILPALLFVFGCSPETLISEDPIMVLDEGAEEQSPPQPVPLSTEANLVQWVATMQQDNGLMESAEDTQFVSLYDNALAALLFIESGDKAKAGRILDYFHNGLEDEFSASGGGFFQFRDLQGQQPSRIWLGDNLWLLLAMKYYQKTYRNSRYEASIGHLETWVRGLQDSDGGLWGGREADGRRIPKVTEGNLMAYITISGNDAFHTGIRSFLATQRWDSQNDVLLAEDSPGPYAHALDLHSLYALYWASDAHPTLTSADRFFSIKTHSLHNIPISGYCFDEDRDVIWLEGSAQMALAYHVNGWSDQYEYTVENLEKSMVSSHRNASLSALPYTANQGSNYGAVPLWDHADDTPTISSSVWFFFAMRGFNPLSVLGAPRAPIE